MKMPNQVPITCTIHVSHFILFLYLQSNTSFNQNEFKYMLNSKLNAPFLKHT